MGTPQLVPCLVINPSSACPASTPIADKLPPHSRIRSAGEILRVVCTGQEIVWILLGVVIIPAAWPWLSCAVFQIFQISMRRARVSPIHMLRIYIYSCDVIFWWGLIILAVVLAGILFGGLAAPRFTYIQYVSYGDGTIRLTLKNSTDGLIWLASLIMWAYVTWRMRAACQKYLQFSFPLGTAVSVQIIVFLFVACVLLLPVWFR
jgi:hypothetical protein